MPFSLSHINIKKLIYFAKYRAPSQLQNLCSSYEIILDFEILIFPMILHFYLNLGTSYLHTSSIWDEHLLEKYLPIESCQRQRYQTKLPLTTSDSSTGIPGTAAASL